MRMCFLLRFIQEPVLFGLNEQLIGPILINLRTLELSEKKVVNLLVLKVPSSFLNG